MKLDVKSDSNLISTTYGKVRSESLVPIQQTKSAVKILRSADVYQQRFLKFNEIGIFHSYAEYIHAALLESNPNIDMFVPQPYSFRVGRKRYIPDCYFQDSGKKHVIEIKPRGEFSEEISIPITQYLDFYNIKFTVISNETILEQEVCGLNWIQIIQTLVSARFEDTSNDEHQIWKQLTLSPQLTIGEIVDYGDRISNRLREIALFRLTHVGKVNLGIDKKLINYDTEVTICT